MLEFSSDRTQHPFLVFVNFHMLLYFNNQFFVWFIYVLYVTNSAKAAFSDILFKIKSVFEKYGLIVEIWLILLRQLIDL